MDRIRRELATYFQSQDFERIQFLLLGISVVLGLCLRLYGLDVLGPWSDELASIFYAENPGLIFYEETHPPLFYLYLNLFTSSFGQNVFLLRLTVALTGVLLIFWAIYLASKIFSKNEVILFSVLMFLCQTDIVHSRMIRQYAIFLELTVILFLLANSKQNYFLLKLIVGIVLTGIHPLGILIPFSFLLDELIIHRKWTRNLKVYLYSMIPVMIYYGAKFLSSPNNLSHLFSNHEKANYFIYDILLTFAGEHYPKINVDPVSNIVLIITALFVCFVLGKGFYNYYKNREVNPFLRQLLILVLVSIVAVEIISEGVLNIRVGRYLIFLLGPFILAFVVSFKQQKWLVFPIFVLQLLILLLIKPLYYYPSEREAIAFIKKAQSQDPNLALVLCANKYQYSYFMQRPHEHCLQQLEKVKNEGKSFVFVDLNGFGRTFLMEMEKEYIVEDLRSYGISISAVALKK